MTARREEILYHSNLPIYKTNEWMTDIEVSFTDDKTDFLSFSVKFNDPYGDNLLAAINASKNVVPDSQQVDIITGLTNILEEKMDIGRIELQKLFKFVEDAFPHNSAKLNQAGKNDYLKARQIPEKMISLLGEAKDFADDNAVALDGVGYSAAMAGALTTAKDDIQTALKNQNKAQKDRPELTQIRRETVNTAYDMVRDLCEDAKIIYVHNNAKYNKYLIPGVDSGSSVSGGVNEGGTANAMIKEFLPTDELTLESTGSTDLKFCLSPDAVTACASGVTVPAGESVTVQASELGDTANQYLNVTNLDAGQAGSWKVTLG